MKGLGTLASLAYPFLIYVGLTVMQPRVMAVIVGAALVAGTLLRLRRGAAAPLAPFIVPGTLIALILVSAALVNERRLFLFVPTLINMALLIGFARTLRRGPSMVESLARSRVGSLSDEEVAYCRRVTIVWCAFFVLNGGVISWLALYGSLEQWTLYTGIIAYVLVGILFGLELVYRSWRFPRNASALALALLRVLPPRRVG